MVKEVLSDTDLLLNLAKSKAAAPPSSEATSPSSKALVLLSSKPLSLVLPSHRLSSNVRFGVADLGPEEVRGDLPRRGFARPVQLPSLQSGRQHHVPRLPRPLPRFRVLPHPCGHELLQARLLPRVLLFFLPFSLAERALFWISASPSRWTASSCSDSIRAARRSTRP